MFRVWPALVALALALVVGTPTAVAQVMLERPADDAVVRETSYVSFDYEGVYFGEVYISDTLPPQQRPKVELIPDREFWNELYGTVGMRPFSEGLKPGTYYWTVCGLPEDSTEDVCGEPRRLRVLATRVAPLSRTTALRAMRAAVRRRVGSRTFSVLRTNVERCSRIRATRMRCRFSYFIGDTVYQGQVIVANDRNWRRYTIVRGRLTYINTYCSVIYSPPCRKHMTIRARIPR